MSESYFNATTVGGVNSTVAATPVSKGHHRRGASMDLQMSASKIAAGVNTAAASEESLKKSGE